jgi:hypothetical protein
MGFDDTAPICVVCTFRETCKPMHEANLVKLREACGIKKVERRKKVTADPAQEGGLTVPKKTLELVDKFEQAGLSVTTALAEGKNPFAQTAMHFMTIASHLLLRLNRPLRQADLCMALQTKLHWTKGTADSHARMAIQALEYVGAVRVTEGGVRLAGVNEG